MKRIIQNGVIDYSDEGDQARQIGVKIDLDLFLESLPEPQKGICGALWGSETIQAIALSFQVSQKTVYRHRQVIKAKLKNWVK